MATSENVETCPEAFLEELRDAATHASGLEQQANILRAHAWTRVAKKLGLRPNDSISLETGVITRATAA